ncbi:hypothetical protein PF010_g30999 [Phytophthora fragariae]|uniref:Uncharacterized protein n=1 Tax=Phytophthora fragariae TaxID=53985 RepID=A0A6A3PR82_9STRA|nr:hypothetical protein PF007_g31931 [Phytophthora fragariae]KAE9058440.1 hypothetical protein PF010_g30999 [Phytophthora fragariae]KAE9083294.1 hypothetical protein PF006_g26716 [Phytophthora fragariae]KAE9263254.1 hypothetical protein PF001_g31752 [Phytophthora fragariae]KAE9280517.1 hypothetical protein PF008_g28116 [Phytophthora fragariae]
MGKERWLQLCIVATPTLMSGWSTPGLVSTCALTGRHSRVCEKTQCPSSAGKVIQARVKHADR